MKIAKDIALGLLKIGAVKIKPADPFTWTSGIRSPIYCDNRKSLSDVILRTRIRDAFVNYIKSHFTDIDAIGGVATAGIAQGAIIAQELQLPYFYVRPEPKKHGMKNQIEGSLPKGAKVVLIEDLISTGLSSLKAVDAVREHGAAVESVLSIFTYGFESSRDAFASSKCSFHSLSQLETLMEVAISNGFMKSEELDSLKEWQKDIQAWSNTH